MHTAILMAESEIIDQTQLCSDVWSEEEYLFLTYKASCYFAC